MTVNMGNFVFVEAIAEVVLPNGQSGPPWLRTHTLPTEEGIAEVDAILRASGRKYTSGLAKDGAGQPRFKADYYDLDGHVVVGTLDYANVLTDLITADYNGTGQQLRAELAARIDHTDQPS